MPIMAYTKLFHIVRRYPAMQGGRVFIECTPLGPRRNSVPTTCGLHATSAAGHRVPRRDRPDCLISTLLADYLVG